MADNPPTIGKLIEGEAQKDAIHIAVAPVVAAEMLRPGEHVGFVGGGTERVSTTGEHIGIIDPYLTASVKTGERCFLFMYVNTITGLRHEWTHPAFGGPVRADPKAASEAWLRNYADEIGLSYSRTLEAAREFLRSGDYHVFNYDTPSIVHETLGAFWQHFEIVTGEHVHTDDRDRAPFSCSC